MLVHEVYIDRTHNAKLGESELFEPFTDNIGKLFRAYQREYGRCSSKVYRDTKNGAEGIGWVFERDERYTDCNEHYRREVWVTLIDRVDPPIPATLHPLSLEKARVRT